MTIYELFNRSKRLYLSKQKLIKMKKITILACLISLTAFAQNSNSYSTSTQENPVITVDSEVTITSKRANQNERIVIETFTSLADFLDVTTPACEDDTFTFEDFSSSPEGIVVCGETISSAGDGCFSAGALENGFTVTSSDFADSPSVVSIAAGALGNNSSSLVGAGAFPAFTIIIFDEDVYAVGFEVWENNDPNTIFRIFSPNGDLIDTFTATTPTNSQTFFGFYADEPVGRIEIEGANDSGELFGEFVFGADCSNLGIQDDDLEAISMFPNPTTDVISVNLRNTIATSLTLIDLEGKKVLSNRDSNTIDISKVASGLYLLQVSTSNGSTTRKVIKQ